MSVDNPIYGHADRLRLVIVEVHVLGGYEDLNPMVYLAEVS